MGPGTVSSRRFLGIVTRAQTAFHDVVEAELFATVSGYLVDLQERHLLATSVFACDADVLCWLTNPLTREVVVSSCDKTLGAPAGAGFMSWLAIVNGSSSAVFEMNKTGLSSAVAVLASSRAGASIVRKCSSAAGATMWLSTSSATDILSVLWATTGVDASAPCAARAQSPIKAGCLQPGSCDSVNGPAATYELSEVGCSFSVLKGAHPRGRSLGPPVALAPAPDVDGMATTHTGRASLGSSRLQNNPPPLPLPFFPSKKRRLHLASPSPISQSLASRSAPTAPCTSVAAVKTTVAPTPSAIGCSKSAANGRARCAEAVSSGWQHAADGSHERAFQAPLPIAALTRLPPADEGAYRVLEIVEPSLCSQPSSGSRTSVEARARTAARTSSDASVGADSLPMSAARHRDPVRLGRLSAQAATGMWEPLYEHLAATQESMFISGGPGVGKTTFLQRFNAVLRKRHPAEGSVVTCTPTGSSAYSAAGVTYHSFFGFPKEYAWQEKSASREAARLLLQRKYGPVVCRLAQVRVVLLDEVSMISADRLDVMVELVQQSRSRSAPPCVFYAFGDFLQLRSYCGDWAFNAHCWQRLFGENVLELTKVHRQHQQDYVAAIHDARFGVYT